MGVLSQTGPPKSNSLIFEARHMKFWSKVNITPHLYRRLFCSVIRRFFMRGNLSRRVVTHTR